MFELPLIQRLNLLFFRKKIKKLDVDVSRNVQIIATMRHEMDILSCHRANFKQIETENAEMKSKLNLMVAIESVLTASQQEVDQIIKENMNAKDLAVMVGTLRRELNSNEVRKNEIRKQMQLIKNDLRAEQDQRRKLQDKLSYYESENHRLLYRLRKLEKDDAMHCSDEVVESSIIESPEPAKRLRLGDIFAKDLNTSSPLTQEQFHNRVAQVKESDSPYLKVKASSIALSAVLKKPMQMRDTLKSTGTLKKSKTFDGLQPKLSIFNKPRLNLQPGILKSQNFAYNGMGGTSKILESDLKTLTKPLASSTMKLKKLSPTALRK